MLNIRMSNVRIYNCTIYASLSFIIGVKGAINECNKMLVLNVFVYKLHLFIGLILIKCLYPFHYATFPTKWSSSQIGLVLNSYFESSSQNASPIKLCST